jgi:RimJ/RimL family protein N-acetyltransferase
VKPFTLKTARLVLDEPTSEDVPLMTTYCQDPIFKEFLPTPWPYQREDAVTFIESVVPARWADDSECSWAVRVDGEFAGMLGFRTGNRDLGFWLGAPHRGHGYMAEAVSALLDWAFASSNRDVLWECYLGNLASAGVARRAGFSFRGEGTALVPARDGTYPMAWKGTISATDSRDPKPGWPIS